MAIDMSNVKYIDFNNKRVKRIEDANGNVLWPTFKGVIATPRKILSEILSGYNYYYLNPLYLTISQLSSSTSSPSSSNSGSDFYFFTENQILALLDDNFDFNGDGMYNNEFIGYLEDGYFHMKQYTPGYSQAVYICFIQNNKIYFVSNIRTNNATNNGLLGYTDDYTNAYMFIHRRGTNVYGDLDILSPLTGQSYYVDNRNTLKYKTSYTSGITYSTGYSGSDTTIPYQSITNPNANN